jgi:putative ABC transport system permease protein
MMNSPRTSRSRFWLWLIRAVGVIVPRRLRADWRQEWEAELRHREALLAEWDKLNWRSKLDLLRRSASAFWDALWLQPKRLEDEMFQDLRFGVRMLLKHKGFTTVAVLSLALGIGANTAIFSVANVVLLRPLDFKDSDRLVMIWETIPKSPQATTYVSSGNFLFWKERAVAFDQIAALSPTNYSLTNLGEPERINGAWITTDFLPALGVSPVLGRSFFDEEGQPGRDQVAIISYGLWQRRFGANPEAIGKEIALDGKPFTLVGVLPSSFEFPTVKADIWTPLVLSPGRTMQVVGRLKPGVARTQAEAEIKGLLAALQQQDPRRTEREASLVPLQQEGVTGVRWTIWILQGAVGMLLLIACANVANLLLVRATGRSKELAVRAALGASRLRLARQLFTESFLLSLLGGVAGLLVAVWCINFFVAHGPADIPRLQKASLDARVISFTLGLAVLTALLSSLAPMLRVSKADVYEVLKEGGQTVAGGRRSDCARRLIMMAEISLTVVLLISAGLLIKSYALLQRVDPGLKPERVLAMRIPLRASPYAQSHQRIAFLRSLLARVQAMPGVQSAAVTDNLPLSGSSVFYFTNLEGTSAGQAPLRVETHSISSDYFRALGIPLLKGRAFTERDTSEAPGVIIISESLARRYFPDTEALGKKIQVILGKDQPREIIGIAGDVKHRGLDKAAVPEMYFPYLQMPPVESELMVRTLSDPAGLVAALKNEVWAMDKDQPIARISTLENLMSGLIAQRQFNTLLLAAFALAALALATIGIYGVVSYAVTQRTHEIGIRMALGAEPRNVLMFMVGQGMRWVLTGVVIGLGAALALTRLMTSLLYGLKATDPATFIGLTLLLVAVAFLACYLPARGATQVDPLSALRHD